MTKKYKVIESPIHSTEYNKRYIIVDTDDDSKILDDAQGYGYKTKYNAHKAWAYKNRDKSKDKEKEERINHIKKWMKEHKGFVRWMGSEAFYCAKDREPFDEKYVSKMLKEENLEIDFTVKELMKVWSKY